MNTSITIWADFKGEIDVKKLDQELGKLLGKYGCVHYDGPVEFRGNATRMRAFEYWNDVMVS